MYPAELLAFLWEHKHPHVYTLGIEANRWGARARRDAGVDGSYGTFWHATTRERHESMVLPCGCVPWRTVRDSTIDPEKHIVRGETTRGWRSFFENLVKSGILRSSNELSCMIGEDTWGLTPKEFRF
jgi:predicted small integral membrane protein